MINSYVENGAMIDYVATKEVGYHEIVKIGDLVGITRKSAKKDEVVSCDVEGVFRLAKKKGEALKAGAVVYLSADGVTATKGTEPKAGIVWANAAADDEIVHVKLNA